MLATLSACKDDIKYNVTHFDNCLLELANDEDIARRIDSLDQLTEFCIEKGIPINDKDYTNYDSEICEKLRSYDKKFFKSKSLIIAVAGDGYPQNLELESLEIRDGLLVLNISIVINFNLNEYPNTGDWQLYLIEIKKKSIKDVGKIVVKQEDKYISWG